MDFDLESELFDDLYDDARSASAVAEYLWPSSRQAIEQSKDVDMYTFEQVRNVKTESATRAKEIDTRNVRLRELRRLSDQRLSETTRGSYFEAAKRVDHSLAVVASQAILEARRSGPSRLSLRRNAPIRVQDLEQAFLKELFVKHQEVSTSQVDRLVREHVGVHRVESLQSLVDLYALQARDSFDKLLIIRDEFQQYTSAAESIKESELNAFLSMMMCSFDSTMIDKLVTVQDHCKGIPHLHVIMDDPTLRFSLGRAATCCLRAMVMIYQQSDNHAGEIPTALADLSFVIRVLLGHIYAYFPALRTKPLEEGVSKKEKPLFDNPGLICRRVIEEAVAVPMFHTILQPLYLASEYGEQDRLIDSICQEIVQTRTCPQVLLQLQVSEQFILASESVPYQRAISLLQELWTPGQNSGAGPMSKVGLLVRACRMIPECIAQAGKPHEIGADDLLPVFVFCVIWSQPKQLASIFHFVENILLESLLSSESGYALTLLQAALGTIPTLKEESNQGKEL